MLVFSALGMFLFHSELRFPHCLTLIPLAIVVLFITNALRIAALILIGHWVMRILRKGGSTPRRDGSHFTESPSVYAS